MKRIATLKSILSSLAFLCLVGMTAIPAHAATEAAARVVKYSKEDIVPVRAKLRFSTLIVLPEDEEILDFTTGDKEFWVINGAHNLCYVHPAQAGIRSNLNLITASGHVYSFLLTEISNQPNAEPDLKIFIEPKEGSGIAVSTGLRGYVSAGEAEAYKKELETLRSQTADQIHAAQAQSADQLNLFRSSYATKRPATQQNSNSTTRSTRKLAASRSWSPPSTTTTRSPTSSAPRGKSPLCMKSRMASPT